MKTKTATKWDEMTIGVVTGVLLTLAFFVIAMPFPKCEEPKCNCPGFWELHAENYSNCAVSCPTSQPLQVKPYTEATSVATAECDVWEVHPAWLCMSYGDISGTFEDGNIEVNMIIRETPNSENVCAGTAENPVFDTLNMPCCVESNGDFPFYVKQVCKHYRVGVSLDPYWDD